MSVIVYKSEGNSQLGHELYYYMKKYSSKKEINNDTILSNSNTTIVKLFAQLLDQFIGYTHISAAFYKAAIIDDNSTNLVPVNTKTKIKKDIRPLLVDIVKCYYISQGLYYCNDFKCNKCVALCSGLPVCIYQLYNYDKQMITAFNKNKSILFENNEKFSSMYCWHFAGYANNPAKRQPASECIFPEYVEHSLYTQSYNYHLLSNNPKEDYETLRRLTELYYIPALKQLAESIEYNIPDIKKEVADELAKLPLLTNIATHDYRNHYMLINPLANDTCAKSKDNDKVIDDKLRFKDINNIFTSSMYVYKDRITELDNLLHDCILVVYELGSKSNPFASHMSRGLLGLLPHGYETGKFQMYNYEDICKLYEVMITCGTFQKLKTNFYGTDNEYEINKKHKELLEMVLYSNDAWCCSKNGENNPFNPKHVSRVINTPQYNTTTIIAKYPFRVKYYIYIMIRLFINHFNTTNNPGSRMYYKNVGSWGRLVAFYIYYLYKSVVIMYSWVRAQSDIRMFVNINATDLQDKEPDNAIDSLFMIFMDDSFNMFDTDKPKFLTKETDDEYIEITKPIVEYKPPRYRGRSHHCRHYDEYDDEYDEDY